MKITQRITHDTAQRTSVKTTGGTWFQRALVGTAGLALVGAVTFGLAHPVAPAEESATGRLPTTYVTPRAAGMSEHFRALKLTQAEQHADAATSVLARPRASLPKHYRELKEHQLSQWLGEEQLSTLATTTLARYQFQAVKERQAVQQADAATRSAGGAATSAISDAYRQLKDRQLEEWLIQQ